MLSYNYVNFSIFLNHIFDYLPFLRPKKDVLMSGLLRENFSFSIKHIITQLNPGPCLHV